MHIKQVVALIIVLISGIILGSDLYKERPIKNLSATIATSQLDITKLPLGDMRVSTSPKKGYIYSCQTRFNGSGAFRDGPWIDNKSKTWDLTKKITVDGDVRWVNTTFSLSKDGNSRIIKSNGIPYHNTGTYPVSTQDDAYQYDRNPNSIKEQIYTATLPANPSLLASPECAGGQVGIMLSGAPLFNGFDAGGKDAVAHEIQDKCQGHPQQSGQYHYHGPSDCIKDNKNSKSHSDLIGYAFDGFGIYGKKGENGKILSSQDLDECHGHTHETTWDGKKSKIFHYHMTNDFPYSVGCFRAKKALRELGQNIRGNDNFRSPPPPPRPF